MDETIIVLLTIYVTATIIMWMVIIRILSKGFESLDDAVIITAENISDVSSALEGIESRMPHDDLEGLQFINIRSRKDGLAKSEDRRYQG